MKNPTELIGKFDPLPLPEAEEKRRRAARNFMWQRAFEVLDNAVDDLYGKHQNNH